jgi:hypothetical protein
MGMDQGTYSAKTWEQVAENLETKPSAETDLPIATAEAAAPAEEVEPTVTE